MTFEDNKHLLKYKDVTDFDELSDEEKADLSTADCFILAEIIDKNCQALGIEDDYIPLGVGFSTRLRYQSDDRNNKANEVFISYIRTKTEIETPVIQMDTNVQEKQSRFHKTKQAIVIKLLNPVENLLADRNRKDYLEKFNLT